MEYKKKYLKYKKKYINLKKQIGGELISIYCINITSKLRKTLNKINYIERTNITEVPYFFISDKVPEYDLNNINFENMILKMTNEEFKDLYLANPIKIKKTDEKNRSNKDTYDIIGNDLSIFIRSIFFNLEIETINEIEYDVDEKDKRFVKPNFEKLETFAYLCNDDGTENEIIIPFNQIRINKSLETKIIETSKFINNKKIIDLTKFKNIITYDVGSFERIDRIMQLTNAEFNDLLTREPVKLKKNKDGYYDILDGHHRVIYAIFNDIKNINANVI